jgi:hypothetical protein
MPGFFRKGELTHDLPGFSAPAEPCPLTSEILLVKQVNRAGLSRSERGFLNAAFRGFIDGVEPPGRASEWLAREAEARGADYRHENRVPRRYDGDETLPPGRYYTVAKGREGDDGGTLCREMQFYMNAAAAEGHVEIFDPVVPSDRKSIAALGMDADAEDRIVARYLPFAQDEGPSAPMGILFSIPLVTEELRVEKVLDLRRPAAADWLCRTISTLQIVIGDTRLPCYASRGGLTSFAQMLPSLLDQSRGGGNFHKIVGLYLRQLKVEGLVFPSARSDIRLRIDQGQPAESYGWCFVDYRDTPNAQIVAFVEVRPDWPVGLVIEGGDDNTPSVPAFASEVTFHANDLGDGQRVVSVTGLEQRLLAHYLAGSMEAAIRYRIPDAEDSEITTVLRMIVSLPAQRAAGLAAMVLFSLLGLGKARDDLRRFIEHGMEEHPVKRLLGLCCDPPAATRGSLTRSKVLLGMLGGGG